MLDTIANKLDDATEILLTGTIIAIVGFARAVWYALAAVAPIVLVAIGVAMILPIWGAGIPMWFTVPIGVVSVLLCVRIGVAELIWLRAKVARMLYLRQLIDNMPESPGGYHELRHSWCERKGVRHEVVLKQVSCRSCSVYVDGNRIDRYYSDWLEAFEDVSVLIMTGKV